MNRSFLIFLAALFPMLSLAQGLVDVNHRIVGPIVTDPGGMPLTGTNYLAQIVYGPHFDSITNLLGGPMPFRAPTTASPGTWDPGTENIRVLSGFTEGQRVWMQVRVWDSEIFPSWLHVSAALASGSHITETYAGSSSFEYVVGSAQNPDSLLLVNFHGFQLTSISNPGPGPCYSWVAPVKINVPWNGDATSLNLLPLLQDYLSTNRFMWAAQWTNDTPVERLFPDFEGAVSITNYLEISGTLCAARFASRTNVAGEFTFRLSPDIGYRSYVSGGDWRICGVRAGSIAVRFYRPPRFVLFPPTETLIPVRIEGMPDTSYRILRSDHLGNFTHWMSVTTGSNGLNQEIVIDRRGQSDAAFFKAEEVPR